MCKFQRFAEFIEKVLDEDQLPDVVQHACDKSFGLELLASLSREHAGGGGEAGGG